jgi:hypothetical protein
MSGATAKKESTTLCVDILWGGLYSDGIAGLYSKKPGIGLACRGALHARITVQFALEVGRFVF